MRAAIKYLEKFRRKKKIDFFEQYSVEGNCSPLNSSNSISPTLRRKGS